MNWKSIALLTLDDLRRSPVWEIRYAGGAEMVRETRLREITDHPRRGFVVHTSFRYPDSRQVYGYSSPQDPSGLDYIQPTIITDHGHWNVFTGANKPEVLDERLFPIDYESLVPCDGTIWKARIERDPTSASTEPSQSSGR